MFLGLWDPVVRYDRRAGYSGLLASAARPSTFQSIFMEIIRDTYILLSFNFANAKVTHEPRLGKIILRIVKFEIL